MIDPTTKDGNPANSAVNPEAYDGVTYDSPLPQLLAAIDAVAADTRAIVANTGSQRFAAYSLWSFLLIRDGITNALALYPNPDDAPHPKDLADLEKRVEAQVAARARAIELKKPRRPPKTEAATIFQLGAYPPAETITEQSSTLELLRGLNNLHRFICSHVRQRHDAAKTAVREYTRLIAILLGAARPGPFGASRGELRHWDVLAPSRTPAPGLQLPVPSAPMIDVHNILDTGELAFSFFTVAIGEGCYEGIVEHLREATNGDEALFRKYMDALAYAKVEILSPRPTRHQEILPIDDHHDTLEVIEQSSSEFALVERKTPLKSP
jgi:hypothetical protein